MIKIFLVLSVLPFFAYFSFNPNSSIVNHQYDKKIVSPNKPPVEEKTVYVHYPRCTNVETPSITVYPANPVMDIPVVYYDMNIPVEYSYIRKADIRLYEVPEGTLERIRRDDKDCMVLPESVLEKFTLVDSGIKDVKTYSQTPYMSYRNSNVEDIFLAYAEGFKEGGFLRNFKAGFVSVKLTNRGLYYFVTTDLQKSGIVKADYGIFFRVQ